MFERYTETARRVIFFARYEASQFGSRTIETEHLLLGVFREDRALAHRFLGDEPAHETAVPHDVAELQRHIEDLVRRMEHAIATHDFKQARECSDQEREQREKLRQMYEQYHLESPRHGGLTAIRTRIETLTGRHPKLSTSVDLPLSQECKRVLAYGAEEAERLNQPRIGPEHLLLGLLREEKSLAAQVLRESGVELSDARKTVVSGAHNEMPSRSARGAARAANARWGGPAGSMAALQDAGRVLFLARYEAVHRQAACIETIDLLLALLREKEVAERFLGPAKSALQNPKPAPPQEHVAAADLAFSEDCKLVFGFAVEEAAQLGQRTAPAHLLLGILRVETCAAAQILRECGLTAAGIRAQLSSPPPSSDPEQGRKYV